MDEKVRRIRNWSGTGINPSTEDTLQDLLDINTLSSPGTMATGTATIAAQSYSLATGKANLLIQNTGTVLVRIGGSNVTGSLGYKLTPMGSYEFRNVEDQFTIYYIRDTTAGGDGQLTFIPL